MRGGRKRKIPIEWIEDTNRRAVTFSKRRKGIFSKAAELCELSGAQIAILITPVSSQSHKSFYSFGHSSVDSVLSAFLNNERPVSKSNKFWWEDESLLQSEDPNELRCAINSISSILHQVEALRARKLREASEQGNQTLDIPSTSADLDHVEGFVGEGEEQISDDDNGLLFDVDTLELVVQGDQTLDIPSTSGTTSLCVEDDYLGLDHVEEQISHDKDNNNEGLEIVVQENQTLDTIGDLDHLEEEEQITANNYQLDSETIQLALQDCDNDYFDLDHLINSQGQEQELSLDQGFDYFDLDYGNNNNNINLSLDQGGFDFDTNTLMNLDMDDDVSMATTNHNPYSDGALVMVYNEGHIENNSELVIHKDLDEDSLLFSDCFNDLTPIVAL